MADWASEAGRSRGRRHAEDESLHRSPFQRDRDRIIHCAAFRRLKHKTQVFVEHEGDYFRTRLTHSVEVAQIARTIARALRLDEDLAEAVSLAHDLGHPPFGHAGENALDQAMKPYGGFDHNAQALRIVTCLEKRYAEFDGLNLSWETLEGLVKHNGPLGGPRATLPSAPADIADYVMQHDLELESFAGAEAQVAALADDIAYNNHDLDDGLRAGLFTFEEIAELAIVAPWAAEVTSRYPKIDGERRAFETLRRVFGSMVEDVIAESERRIAALAPSCAADIRAADLPMVAFSQEMLEKIRPLRKFLFGRMYRHSRVNRMMWKARRVVREIFELYLAEPMLLSDEWRRPAEAAPTEAERAKVIADYVSGMTDRFAIEEHRRLFDPAFDA
ncbi:MAG: deoxyguanosinetriphosphate triphosphohydrolase [Neomegalonema sp.]|nr:deoxyguanosinetriphosphate triphosphohydrolase [Neomegalonema sp.]